LAIPAALPMASQARAEEMVELYWQALCRDVNFTDYATSPLPGLGSAAGSPRRPCSEALPPTT
jgi:hypothetical protein